MVVLMLASAGALLATLQQKVAAETAQKMKDAHPSDEDMKQAEPIIEEMLSCRLGILAIIKQLDAGRVCGAS